MWKCILSWTQAWPGEQPLPWCLLHNSIFFHRHSRFVWVRNGLSIYCDQSVSPLRSVWNFSSNTFNELIMMVVANFQCWTFQVQIGFELFHWDKLSVTASLLIFVPESYFQNSKMSARVQNPQNSGLVNSMVLVSLMKCVSSEKT